ncbi:MAG: PEP-CTERM sorting domain-containing protein [Armatimonadota bacterium]
MRRIVAVLAVALSATGMASADYVTLDDYEAAGGDYWDFHYTYYREEASALMVGGTWELVGLSGAASSAGPGYWDSGVVSPDGTRVFWTYTGGDSPPSSNYTSFDLTAYIPGGHVDLVPYRVDFDGDGEPDFSGQIGGPVPEAGTLALGALGLGVIGLRLRRRRG